MRLNKKGFGHIGVTLLVLVLLVIGGAGYFVWDRNRTPETETTSDTASDEATDDGDGSCTALAGYLVYNNTDVRFCFAYPEEWGTASVALGVIDVDNESGNGWLGTFSDEANASFAFLADDWEYVGDGRGGPNNAVGFTVYEVFVPSAGDTTDYDIKINTADKQLVGAVTDFNFQGAIIWAERLFVESEPYVGIEFQLNVHATGAFDAETAVVGDFATAAQFDQMTTVLESVTEY